ncbi:MAG: hypothetical protein R3C49_18715 [Planctomycetaceae bacterium]
MIDKAAIDSAVTHRGETVKAVTEADGASTFGPTNSRVVAIDRFGFCASSLARFLGAFAAAVALVLTHRFPWQQFSNLLPFSVVAAILTGVGVHVGIDGRLRGTALGRAGFLLVIPAALLSLCVAGLMSVSQDFSIEAVQSMLWLAAFCAGMATGTDWNSVSEAARSSLPPTQRWLGMNFWQCVAPLAYVVAFWCENSLVVQLSIGSLAAGVICLCLLKSLGSRPAGSIPPDSDTQPLLRPCELAAREKTSAAATGISVSLTESSETPSASHSLDGDCDSVECCGGTRTFRPTSFGVGVALSTLAFLSFWMPLTVWPASFQTHSGEGTAVVFASGLITGFALVMSAAPRVGYVVLAMLFCLSGLIVHGIQFCASEESGIVRVMVFLVGVCGGAVSCALSAMCGELFADCSSNPIRSRVVGTSAFAAALALLAAAGLTWLLSPPVARLVLNAAVPAAGILILRRLPNPILSSLGREEHSGQDDDEYQDVVRSLGKPGST